MTSNRIHLSWLIAAIWALSLCVALAGNGDPTTPVAEEKQEYTYSESEVRARFKAMPSIVSKRFNSTTRHKIKSYMDSQRNVTEQLLGKGSMFFPIIEQYLKEYELPLDLRVLPIIETRLDPTAISHAGATGLWQFMEGTAAEFGLTMDHKLDERIDIHRSTEAAVQYLARLYNKYEDWGLVLAAYNCGPGYVNRAIRRAGSRDYWKVSQYLPRETQKYVPKFLAATYLVNYYHEHGLTPAFPDLDLQITQELRIFKKICFDELARISQVPVSILRDLNPAHSGDCIRERKEGAVITLPRRSARFVAGYLTMPEEGQKYFTDLTVPEHSSLEIEHSGYRMMLYTPDSTETLSSVAAFFGVEESLLRLWNSLEPDPVFDRQRELQIFLPEILPFHLPKPVPMGLIPQVSAELASALGDEVYASIPQLMHGVGISGSYELYTLSLAETVDDLCRLFPVAERQEILEHNPKALWVPGEVIRIPSNMENLATR